MAAAIRLNTYFLMSSIAKCISRQLRAYSASSKTALGGQSLVDKVVTTSDNSTFVAYHPTRDFPYEMSRPLPPLAKPNNLLIKEETIRMATQAFHKKRPEFVIQEFTRITSTTKHRWYPRSRDRKNKKSERQREYL